MKQVTYNFGWLGRIVMFFPHDSETPQIGRIPMTFPWDDSETPQTGFALLADFIIEGNLLHASIDEVSEYIEKLYLSSKEQEAFLFKEAIRVQEYFRSVLK